MIEPPRGWGSLSLKELWRYRELLYFLTWRDIKVRYKQTMIGAAWALLQPFVTMVVFSLIFGTLLRVPSDGVPYPLFAYAALLPWNFAASALTRSSNSLVYDANLISKIFFPRLISPLSAALAPAVDFAIAFLLLVGMLLFYGIVPGVAVLALPLFLLLAFVTAFGLGLWLSALNVKYRDFGYVVPFLTQFWFFVTPVAYPTSVIPEPWKALYALNPMVGVVDGFRWALLGVGSPSLTIFVSGVVASALLIGGFVFFGRAESEFADVV